MPAQSQKFAANWPVHAGRGFCLKEKALSIKNSAFSGESRRLTANKQGKSRSFS
jgi:hypothetical protein